MNETAEGFVNLRIQEGILITDIGKAVHAIGCILLVDSKGLKIMKREVKKRAPPRPTVGRTVKFKMPEND